MVLLTLEGEKMSKSRGNIIPLSRLLNEIGSDLTRINIISSAEGLSDADWRGESVKTFLERINFVFEIVSSLKKSKFSKLRNVDRFLIAKINKVGKEAINAYENLKFRTATQLLFFEFLNDVEWYLKRVGKVKNANGNVLKNVMKKFTILVSPLIPHLAEELWEKLNGKNFVFQAKLPTFEKYDEKAILGENFLHSLIEDIREIKKLVKEQPKEVDIIVAANWKFDLVERMAKGEKIELKNLLEKFDKEERENVAKFYKRVLSQIKELPKMLSKKDELKLLEEARELLEKEAEAKVIITIEERSGLEKAKQAEPLKPAIFFSI
jgi:leucyl-tRNA synthetase